MMKKPIVIYKAFDVVVVPFPFTDRKAAKRRPALVLSMKGNFGDKIAHSVLAMITSSRNAPWPLDVTIQNKKSSGLSSPSVVRMKIFTLDNQLIISKAGRLAKADQAQVKTNLRQLLAV